MRGMLLCAPLLAALCCGCVSVSSKETVVPPSGLFADFSAPLTPISEPVPCTGLKSGTASKNLYLWAWPIPLRLDASICNMALRSAIENGGLAKVYFADYHQDTFLGLVTKFTVTAYGE